MALARCAGVSWLNPLANQWIRTESQGTSEVPSSQPLQSSDLEEVCALAECPASSEHVEYVTTDV